MRSNFLQNYERNLVESAVASAVESAVGSVREDIAVVLRDDGVSHDLILKATGVDVDKL